MSKEFLKTLLDDSDNKAHLCVFETKDGGRVTSWNTETMQDLLLVAYEIWLTDLFEKNGRSEENALKLAQEAVSRVTKQWLEVCK